MHVYLTNRNESDDSIAFQINMVHTVVRFENNQLPSNVTMPVVIKDENRSALQRRIYLIVGILLLIGILVPNILAIPNDYDDFAYHLLFIFHASCLGLFFVSTAIYRSIGDGISTISGLVLFAIYKTIHYLIRYRYCRANSPKDFLITTIQLTILFVFVITYILWTYVLIRNKPEKMKNFHLKQKRIFYSILSLNLVLTISSLILNIRHQDDFGLYQIILLSVGIPLALLWYSIGILMSMYQNCLCITSFYILSLIQPFHIIYLIFHSLNEMNHFASDIDKNSFFPLFIIIFVCVSTNILVHLLTSIAACWMISKTDKTIFNTRWMIASI